MIRVIFILIVFCSVQIAFSQVGIGTITPSDASMLDVNSTLDSGVTYKGFMPPRIPLTSDLVRVNTGIEDAGLQVFVLETGCLNIWNGIAWVEGPCVTIVSGSVVQFSSATQSQVENVPALDFDFTISNPSPSAAIMVSVAADSYTDLDENTAQIVTIPAGATSYTSNGLFTITDDMDAESSEAVVFTVTYLSGGLGTTTIGVQNTNTVTILDDDSIIALSLPFQESFETNGNGSRYNLSIAENISGADYFSRARESDLSGVNFSGSEDGTYLFAAQDINGLSGVSDPLQMLDITGIDITGGSNLLFEVLLVEDDLGSDEHWDSGDGGTGDYVIFEYQIDGGGYQNLLAIRPEAFGSNQIPRIDTDFDGLGDGAEITDTWTDFSENIIGTGTTLDLRINIRLTSGNEDIGIDNIRITSN